MARHTRIRYGDEHWSTRHDDHTVDLARDLYDEGVAPHVIADKLDVPRNTLRQWLTYKTRCRTVSYRTMARRGEA